MTVSELIDQRKDCAPNAEVYRESGVSMNGQKLSLRVLTVQSDGERVVLS